MHTISFIDSLYELLFTEKHAIPSKYIIKKHSTILRQIIPSFSVKTYRNIIIFFPYGIKIFISLSYDINKYIEMLREFDVKKEQLETIQKMLYQQEIIVDIV